MFLIFELRTSTTTSTSSTKYKQQDQVEAGGGAGNFLEIAYWTPLPPNINIVHRAHSHTWKKLNVINFIVKLAEGPGVARGKKNVKNSLA